MVGRLRRFGRLTLRFRVSLGSIRLLFRPMPPLWALPGAIPAALPVLRCNTVPSRDVSCDLYFNDYTYRWLLLLRFISFAFGCCCVTRRLRVAGCNRTSACRLLTFCPFPVGSPGYATAPSTLVLPGLPTPPTFFCLVPRTVYRYPEQRLVAFMTRV